MKKMRYIFSLLLLVCLLLSATPIGDGFMPLSFGPNLKGVKLLMTEIHKSEWKIGYRYGADCKPEDRQNGEALQEAISTAIRVWLKPLKELQPSRSFTDKFIYELQPDFNPNQPEDLKGLQAVDLRVTFECKRTRSGAQIGSFPPAVVMRLGTEVTSVALSTLIHELGHAFGLADTYNRPGIMRSQGGLHVTTGIQPSSIMAMTSHYQGETPLTIGEDDKRGIIWLYNYFYGNLDTNDCIFADYIFVEEISGCRPKHPLIFEAKHNPTIHALQLLKDDPSIDINAQDVGGMTALHYAAMYEKEEVVKALLDHKDIKPFLQNKEGETALDLALATNNTAIIKMFPEPPRRKEDVNRDGEVNILDLVAVASKFGEKDAGTADVNGDGVVDIRDLVLVAGAFG